MNSENNEYIRGQKFDVEYALRQIKNVDNMKVDTMTLYALMGKRNKNSLKESITYDIEIKLDDKS